MDVLIESLHIEWTVVLAQAVSLLVLLVILGKFLYRPFQVILRQREEHIASNLANAEAQQLKAEALRRDYEAHLASVADESRQRLEQAMKDAEAARQRMLEAAQAEVRELYARHQGQLALEHEQLRRELRAEMADIAMLAASKALRAKMTPELQASVIDQVIRELEQAPYH